MIYQKKNMDKLLWEENIPKEFYKIFGQESKFDSYYNITKTKLINCEILKKDMKNYIQNKGFQKKMKNTDNTEKSENRIQKWTAFVTDDMGPIYFV